MTKKFGSPDGRLDLYDTDLADLACILAAASTDTCEPNAEVRRVRPRRRRSY
jgi:hypothetical protein